jgi:alpha-mannosidase
VTIVSAQSTDLFVGSEEQPLQLARIVVSIAAAGQFTVAVEGRLAKSLQPTEVTDLLPGEERTVEVPMVIDPKAAVGDHLPAEAVLETAENSDRQPFEVVVEEPGWTMFMVSHFHYDPVWWNTQAAYTETWKKAGQPWAADFQTHSFDLVRAHLDAARRDPDYAFVLAELDYLKPYWDTYPEDRDYIRRLLEEGRLELIGGTYNEPNTNLVAAENTVRNLIYGIAYQRDVLGGNPATAWQLDAFGHDPQFPGLAADAGLTSSSWARGPFHAWGPFRMPIHPRPQPSPTGSSEPLRMEFPSEFYWVAPSGKKLLTSYMADHYSAGWWMDSALTLEEAEEATYVSFQKLKSVAATKNVLLPVGTDYSPPNKWVSQIARDWNRKYISPRFEMSTTRRFFDAVRSAAERDGVRLRPQSRDMNPLYTGKDVSFIDTKQANRLAENMLIDAEKFATVASLLGARYPTEAVDKAWRQLLFNAHHDGITGSESDQVYLDLLGGWREAWELGRSVLQSAISYVGARIDVPDVSGGQLTIAVFNPSSWARAGLVRLDLPYGEAGAGGLKVTDDTGTDVPVLVETGSGYSAGSPAEATVIFRADDVPPLGYRTYKLITTEDNPDSRWIAASGFTAENDRYLVEVDPQRGGGISRLYDKTTARELLKAREVGNELLACDEYPNHPSFGEGPWHLTPSGGVQGTSGSKAEVTVERSLIGQRLIVRTSLADCAVTQEILLWNGVNQVEFRTYLDGFSGQDTLFRVRFPADCEGAMPVSEVGSAVVGRTFGFPEVDTAEVPFTLEYPAYNWFGLNSCVRVALERAGLALQAISVAEVVAPDTEEWKSPTEQLVTALVRQGVTATVSSPEGARYGSVDIDSNLPDARIALGGPEQNRFTETVLQSAGQEYENEFKRQLSSTGYARVWVPASSPFGEVWVVNPDLRDARALPVLIVAGSDRDSDEQAAADLVNDLADGLVELSQSSELAGDGQLANYGVAVMNRGLPSFTIDRQRGLYLSLLRSCSGWPSGIWIDPPRRTLPDGANFQFQHWSHTFEYAVTGFPGDWRGAQVVNTAHDFNHPLFALVLGPHAGELPARLSFFQVEPASVVLSALKPLGNPMASQARTQVDPIKSFIARVYEANGRPTEVTIRSHWPLADGFVTNLMEETRDRLEPRNGTISLGLSGYQIATVGASPIIDESGRSNRALLGPTAEPAQPVFSAYWLHNKGAAPLGYQPVTVRIRPAGVAADGPFLLTASVASERTDGPAAGMLRVLVPVGWSADPAERPFRLDPGAHFTTEIKVSPETGGSPGRYFIAVRIDDEAGQVHEDISTVDYLAGEHAISTASKPELAVDPVTGRAAMAQSESNRPQLGNELEIELLTPEVHLGRGDQGRIEVRLANLVAGDIRGEVQVLSPYDIWSMISPWTQGFEVAGGETTDLSFQVSLPYGCRSGRYWALIKVMYFGRLHYTEAIPFEVLELVG